MDRFKELGIDTHGRTSGKMKTKCPWCHAQRTDKRDKSLSVNLDTKLYLCHYCGAHGSAAIYAGKGRKLGDPLVKFISNTAHTDNIIWNVRGYFEFLPQPTHYVMNRS